MAQVFVVGCPDLSTSDDDSHSIDDRCCRHHSERLADEGLDRLGDVVGLVEGHVLVNGDAEALFADSFGCGEGSFSVAVSGVGGVEVEGDGIEDGAADALFFEVFHEGIALGGLDGELVPDVVVAGVGFGQDEV